MKILLIRLSSLGDIVLVTPVIEAIKNSDPQAHVSCLVKPIYAGIFGSNPCVNQVLVYKGFWRTFFLLKKEKFDVIADLHGVLKSRLLCLFTPAGKKGTYRKEALRRRAHVWFKNGFLDSVSTAERYLEAVKRLGLVNSKVDSLGWRIPLKGDAGSRAQLLQSILGKGKPGCPIIGMAPGAQWATKRWLPSRYALLARRFSERYPHARVVLLGGPEDRAICERVQADLDPIDIVNLAGCVELGDLPAVISQLKLFISNDSGLLHIASGVGVPTVGIFGPTVKEFGFYPQSAQSRVVETEGLGCRPCSLHGSHRCPRGHFLCMRLIRVEDVLKACEIVKSEK